MRIAHVVTLVSRDGSFGGPVSVARAQVEELARRGHDVTLLAGWDRAEHLQIKGVAVSLHVARRVIPKFGFSGLLAPGVIRRLRDMAPELDVVHVHLARDLVTLPAALFVARSRRTRAKLVTQTHGMVMPDSRLRASLVDRIGTREVLRSAHAATVLTEIERDGLCAVAGFDIQPRLLRNGVALDDSTRVAARGPRSGTVLFCARLHPRKRVLAFAEMARLLIQSNVDAEFVVAGADEGDLPGLRAYIERHNLTHRLRYVGPLRPGDVRERLGNAAVFVLPSKREPFPMTLLEAMAEGTPSVITDGCMIASQLADTGGPIITDGSPEALARAVRNLLENPIEAVVRGQQSRELIKSTFRIESVVDDLERVYLG